MHCFTLHTVTIHAVVTSIQHKTSAFFSGFHAVAVMLQQGLSLQQGFTQLKRPVFKVVAALTITITPFSTRLQSHQYEFDRVRKEMTPMLHGQSRQDYKHAYESITMRVFGSNVQPTNTFDRRVDRYLVKFVQNIADHMIFMLDQYTMINSRPF